MSNACYHYEELPRNLRKPMEMWVEKHFPPGGFLQHVIANDLKESFARADDVNSVFLKVIVSWLYREAPSVCWGSPKKLFDWCNPKYRFQLEVMECKQFVGVADDSVAKAIEDAGA